MNPHRPAPALQCALLLLALPWAGGCDSPELDFGGADAGGGWTAASPTDNGAGGNSTGGDYNGEGSNGGGGGGPGGGGAGGEVTDGGVGELHISLDAEGYPADPGQQNPGCESGVGVDEVCGNAVDDDCDGLVDEQMLVGTPCTPTCADGAGTMACNLADHSLVCITDDLQACRPEAGIGIVIGCGNGMVDRGEWCDPAAPGEIEGETCTVDCRLPLFKRCVFRSTVDHDVCDAWRTCDEWIGACLPYIDLPNAARCPDIAVEAAPPTDGQPPGPEEFYRMAEVDGICRLTCTSDAQCPSSLPVCYMSYCAVDI